MTDRHNPPHPPNPPARRTIVYYRFDAKISLLVPMGFTSPSHLESTAWSGGYGAKERRCYTTYPDRTNNNNQQPQPNNSNSTRNTNSGTATNDEHHLYITHFFPRDPMLLSLSCNVDKYRAPTTSDDTREESDTTCVPRSAPLHPSPLSVGSLISIPHLSLDAQ